MEMVTSLARYRTGKCFNFGIQNCYGYGFGLVVYCCINDNKQSRKGRDEDEAFYENFFRVAC